MARWLALGLLPGLLVNPGQSIAENQTLPDLGNSARTVYSKQAEHKLGRQVMAQIRRDRAFITDPELTAYIQALGSRLTRHASAGHYQFFLVQDTTINAFALPGGYIGINTGLITAAGHESELAAVLAHEISHVDQQHFSRMMAARDQRSGLTAAALLASMVLASSGNQQAGEAGVAITAAANMTQELSYSRNFEREADRLGIQLLAKSGFEVGAMADFFGKLQQRQRQAGGSGPEYLRTHPIESNRIAEARDRARGLARPKKKQNNLEFLYARAKIISLYTQNSDVAEHLLDTTIRAASPIAYDYGRAILLSRINRHDSALDVVHTWRNKLPTDRRWALLEADIQLRSANKSKGLSIYADAYAQSPKQIDVVLRYATALINYRQFEKAYLVLEQARRQAQPLPEIEKLYAQAAGESGRLIDAHRAMAEYYYLLGDTQAALQQLRIASRHASGNQYALASIDARRIEMETEY